MLPRSHEGEDLNAMLRHGRNCGGCGDSNANPISAAAEINTQLSKNSIAVGIHRRLWESHTLLSLATADIIAYYAYGSQ